jgi:hypothetical protein
MNLEGLTEKWSNNPVKSKRVKFYENSVGEIVSKHCSECGEVKNISDYTNAKKGLGGKSGKCKYCVAKLRQSKKDEYTERTRMWRANNKERYEKYNEENKERKKIKNRLYYQENKERLKENSRIWREENKDYHAERYKKWREENKELYLMIMRTWRENNKEHLSEYRKEYVKNNRSIVNLSNQRRRARINGLPDTLTDEQYANTLNYFNNACALTGETKDTEKEHALPISIGHGGTTFENCYPMSSGLNQSKGNKNIFEWFEANRQRFKFEQWRFDRLIEWLASANAMTVEEYRAYVYECHANPNEIINAEAN